MKLFGSRTDRNYLTAPRKELDGRQIYWRRGKVMGESSLMNATMGVRGFDADHNEWGRLAGEQWSYPRFCPNR